MSQSSDVQAASPPTERTYPDNQELAAKLERVSDLLSQQGANRFRAAAYRRAAVSIRNRDVPVWQTYAADGIHGLEQIEGVGRTISRALQQLIRGGRWPLLDRLMGEDVVEKVFASVPNIGPTLAKKIHDELGIETLVELHAAAIDGRLAKMGGFGEKRIRAVRESLSARGRDLGTFVASSHQNFDQDDDLSTEIPVSEILDIDNEYRFRDAQNELPRVAPKRLNPTSKAWLSILHTLRENRHYTALFSNTRRAHEMGTTHDWVVIYLEDHDGRGQHGRWTVITSQFGKLRGRRIVRGREHDCQKYYRNRKQLLI